MYAIIAYVWKWVNCILMVNKSTSVIAFFSRPVGSQLEKQRPKKENKTAREEKIKQRAKLKRKARLEDALFSIFSRAVFALCSTTKWMTGRG